MHTKPACQQTFALALLLLSAPLTAQSVFLVTNTNDSGPGSLRTEAVIDAIASGSA